MLRLCAEKPIEDAVNPNSLLVDAPLPVVNCTSGDAVECAVAEFQSLLEDLARLDWLFELSDGVEYELSVVDD